MVNLENVVILVLFISPHHLICRKKHRYILHRNTLISYGIYNYYTQRAQFRNEASCFRCGTYFPFPSAINNVHYMRQSGPKRCNKAIDDTRLSTSIRGVLNTQFIFRPTAENQYEHLASQCDFD